MGKLIDLTGKLFNRLTVLRRVDNALDGSPQWACSCSCGSEITVLGVNLRSGNTQSCGCLKRELAPTLRRTHGGSHTPLFSVWTGMHSRCNSVNEKCYKDYGGRGIQVCDRWNDFVAFREDMEASYLDHKSKHPYTSLDRIDVNGNYEPNNCKWSTREEQNQNKRKKEGYEVNL